MDRKLRVIVAGTGAMGRAWLGVLRADPRWEIAALVDVAPQALAEAAAQVGVPAERCFGDMRAALAQVQADAALVVTTPETHREVAVAALERGLAVFCEKPLAARLADGAAIAAAARRHGGRLMVGQGRRWLPHTVALRAAIADGLIGELGYLTCQFRIPFRFGGWRDTMPEVLIEDLAIHHLDTIRFITGRNGLRVFAHSFRPAWSWYGGNPCANLDLTLEGDLPVSYFGSWVARGPRSSWDGELIAVGAEGALLLREDETLWHYPGEDERPLPLTLLDLAPRGLELGLDRFTSAVRGAGAFDPDAEDNLQSLALTSAAVESARTGRMVDVRAHLESAGHG